MSKVVVEGAKLRCNFGQMSSSLSIVRPSQDKSNGKKIATIMDFIPNACIAGFGQCSSPLNPAVISAFGAPQPCTPLIVSPWAPPSTKTRIGGIPVLIENSKNSCMYAPMGISITDTQQNKFTTK